MTDDIDSSAGAEATAEEQRRNVIRLAFGERQQAFDDFVRPSGRRFRPAPVSSSGAAP